MSFLTTIPAAAVIGVDTAPFIYYLESNSSPTMIGFCAWMGWTAWAAMSWLIWQFDHRHPIRR